MITDYGVSICLLHLLTLIPFQTCMTCMIFDKLLKTEHSLMHFVLKVKHAQVFLQGKKK